MSVPEERDGAYALLACMYVGTPPDVAPEVLHVALGEAIVIVLADERKTRSAAERSIQRWTRTTLALGALRRVTQAMAAGGRS